ncbi:MAG TPA: RHS repeat-associated core domain-containing protein, partial [Bacteroidales bacterium]|nr:RHS repeat-associated core domain-containing protein [Bacteroidales bacterium]
KGYAIQHLHYLPFGEDWVDQRNASWSAPYTFSGKEKDVETGYSYFGARYYDSGLSIWLSVDPMSDKYPNLTPYNYCANNPVILVDPDGEEFGDFYNQFGLYLGTDGIDDGRVYQTTDGVWFKNIIFSFLSYNSTSIPFANESKKNSYDNVKADPETDFLGVKNEFGLIQLTKMGNPGIINNDEREDSYSYLQKDGTMSPKAKHGDDWADPVVAAAFNYAVKQSGVTVVVNDASAYNPSYNLGHKTHKMGRDIDYKYITSNGVGSTNCFGLTKSDILLNKNFVKQLKLAGFITISCGRIPGTITDSSGIHDNHMHSSKK